MTRDPVYQAQVWLKSCQQFVVTSTAQLEQAQQQLEKAEDRLHAVLRYVTR